MRPIETSSFDFPQMRENGCIYVDKTAFLHRMITNVGTRCLFLARPRRFGKSLMISTLKAIFEGRRELFRGLAIDALDWSWQKHPIIHFDFSQVKTGDIDTFQKSFDSQVKEALAFSGFEYDERCFADDNFAAAIERLHSSSNGKGVVVLIDEYDAPVGHALANAALAEEIRRRMAEFFIVIKRKTPLLKFVMITGVSKMAKLSVWSALSNLADISGDVEYSTLCGYTDDELSDNFGEHLQAHAKAMGLGYGEYRELLKCWYNGFRFSKDDPLTVYSPISIAIALSRKSRTFEPTWTATARSSVVMNYLKRDALAEIDLSGQIAATELSLEIADLRNIPPVGLLYQAGYLTIADYDSKTGLYSLGAPDEEVRRDLALLSIAFSADRDDSWAADLGKKLLVADWGGFFAGLKALYAGLAYGSKEQRVHEAAYARILKTLLVSQGIRTVSEATLSDGRADIVGEHAAGIFIFELKVGAGADLALKQIRAKGYAEPYAACGLPIWLIGLSFDPSTRRLADAAAVRFASNDAGGASGFYTIKVEK